METSSALLSRRSVRKFTGAGVLRKDLEAILEAGLAAPSAVNSQPWYIVAVHSAEKMAELKKSLAVTAKRLRPELERAYTQHPDVIEDTYRAFSQLGGAPMCLMAFAKKPGEITADTIQSVAAAIENMILAAWDIGIASCWMTGPVNFGLDELVRDVFAPDAGKLLSIIPMGYPDQVPAMPPRKAGRYTIV